MLAFGVQADLSEEKVKTHKGILTEQNKEGLNNEEQQKIELGLEHMKGMGGAPDTIHAITGYMRAELKSDEATHAPEQYNYQYHQPMDQEWIAFSPEGEIIEIKSEKELINLFNNVRAEGYNMDPNPHWAWKLEKDKYVKDENLAKIFTQIDQMELLAQTEEEKLSLGRLKEQKLDVGLQAINRECDRDEPINKLNLEQNT